MCKTAVKYKQDRIKQVKRERRGSRCVQDRVAMKHNSQSTCDFLFNEISARRCGGNSKLDSV